jgi:hypothetical protein
MFAWPSGLLAKGVFRKSQKKLFVSRKIYLAAHRPVNKGDMHPDKSGLAKKL